MQETRNNCFGLKKIKPRPFVRRKEVSTSAVINQTATNPKKLKSGLIFQKQNHITKQQTFTQDKGSTNITMSSPPA